MSFVSANSLSYCEESLFIWGLWWKVTPLQKIIHTMGRNQELELDLYWWYERGASGGEKVFFKKKAFPFFKKNPIHWDCIGEFLLSEKLHFLFFLFARNLCISNDISHLIFPRCSSLRIFFASFFFSLVSESPVKMFPFKVLTMKLALLWWSQFLHYFFP